MDQLIDSDPNSNNYFFITGLNDVFGAGKNSFTVNCTNKVVDKTALKAYAYDINGNVLPVGPVDDTFVVTVPQDTPYGIGQLEMYGTGIDTGLYTGSIAYYNNQAYAVDKNTRLPLLQAPNSTPFPKVEVKWVRKILINTERSTASEIKFFDLPNINVVPELYYPTNYSTGSYRLASGSCSAVAVNPKNNDVDKFDYSTSAPIYQIYAGEGFEFKGSMVGEKIRIKNPYVKNFTYTNYTNNQVTYEGVLNTDFVVNIKRVISNKTLLVDMPFSTVADAVERANQDSEYNRNNLVDIFGYNISDDPMKQSMYKKRNFYVLSITDAQYEIFYKDIPDTASPTTGSSVKSLINMEFNNLRAYAGHVDSYKIYGRSLNTPEYKVLLCEGKVLGEELMVSKNFKSGVHNTTGKFFSQAFTDRFWFTGSSNIMFYQDHSGYIDGAMIGNNGTAGPNDYALFKDDTTGNLRTPSYVPYSYLNNSYWYTSTDAFLNSTPIPTASYGEIVNIPILSGYTNSIEKLMNGAIYDSNPIKLRQATLYEFSVYVRPLPTNNENSNIKVYFLSGDEEKLIGVIDNSFKYNSDEVYSNTFFNDVTKFGTIKLVPSDGRWYITDVSLKPYKNVDYSMDSFSVKVPLQPLVANELYDIEAELYDAAGKLAYGTNSYTFENNKVYLPLKKRIFIDPMRIAVVAGGGGGIAPLIIDGGGA